MSETKQWKRVGDYPPPRKGMIVVRHPNSVGGYSNPYTILAYQGTLEDRMEWCEVEIPTEVAPPPIDEQLEAEAQALRATWTSDPDPDGDWIMCSTRAKDRWRKVALKARELHTQENPWRPMSELSDGHPHLVEVAYSDGSPPGRVIGSVRSNDVVHNRVLWRYVK